MDVFNGNINPTWSYESGWDKYSEKSAVYVTILMRGVDPHSTSQPMKIGLGRVFAKLNHWENSVDGNFKLNIPMQPNDGLDFGSLVVGPSQTDAYNLAHRCVKHESITSNNPLSIDTGYSKGRLFFKPYHFIPSQNNWTSFTTKSPYNFIKTSESDVQENTLSGYDVIPNLPYQMAYSYTFASTSRGKGIRIRDTNYYSYADYVSFPISGNILITGGPNLPYANRSYQPGEPVEGIPFTCLGGVPFSSLPTPNLFSSFLGFQRSKFLNSIYYSKKYSDGLSLTMSNNERIVMRSDRLPTSDIYQRFQAKTMGGMAN